MWSLLKLEAFTWLVVKINYFLKYLDIAEIRILRPDKMSTCKRDFSHLDHHYGVVLQAAAYSDNQSPELYLV